MAELVLSIDFPDISKNDLLGERINDILALKRSLEKEIERLELEKEADVVWMEVN